MKKIIRFRWLIFSAWIIFAAVLAFYAPNMEGLVREKGQITVPDDYPSSVASQIIADHQGADDSSESIVIVFSDTKPLTKEQLDNIEGTLKRLEKKAPQLGTANIISHFSEPGLEKQLVSEDGKTILALVDVRFGEREISAVQKQLKEAVDTEGVNTHMTGNAFISEDVIVSSQNGLKKTEIITLIFILVVLVLVFRSVVAPIIPLVTVGITYIASQSIVAFLVDRADFPLSNFTQIFLVAILFGIGTDYCILLLSRFKEELSVQESTETAIVNTFKTAGRTVLFSGVAVLTGFASIGFADFKLYQSAAAVAVGVAVLLLALGTIVPFFMAVLGRKLFWPVKGNMSHQQSKLWGLAGQLSLYRPILTLLIVAVITVPLLIKYDGSLSFNSLDEIGDDYHSVKAFNLISDSFGPGESLPSTIVIENDESMKSSEYLTLIEQVSSDVAKIESVEKVRSATRPAGDPVKDLYVSEQARQLNQGLSEGNEGINTIKDGLEDASSAIDASAPEMTEAVTGVEELVTGTNQLQSGVGDVKTALQTIEAGMRDGTLGIGQIKVGLIKAKAGTGELLQGSSALLQGIDQMHSNTGGLLDNYRGTTEGLVSLQQRLASLETPFANVKSKYPVIAADEDFLTIESTVHASSESLGGVLALFNGSNDGLAGVHTGLSNSKSGLENLHIGLDNLNSGLEELISGASALEQGFQTAADGQGQIVDRLPQLAAGLSTLAAGQGQLETGFGELASQLTELGSGLNEGADGLGEISGGLVDASAYLENLSNATDEQMSGFYIPEDVIKGKEFQQVFDTYMSEDGKMTTIDVVFANNPYANDTLKKVDEINEAVSKAVAGTKLENANVGVSGVTSVYNDLQNISDSDYSRTVWFMLIGIGLILVVLLKSLIMPIYLVGSLILTYFSSLAITEVVFVNILGYQGINWAVPFFGFVILMALGVDYSIFLMDRFNEYRDMSVEKAMMLAMRNMGTVIISAVIILAGTFAAMLPSGVLSLLQIATLVLSGLLLYALIILPLFVPVMVRMFGKANWWPFIHLKR
ncbi:hypothetical protein CVD25_20440 [Bacillus canaveralius]|uniref:Membrane transport protein MMPL domain-containing protein n=1 Tax=Bacillus canaveralius TaxID=1403243 RepID=A0A2N5GJK0_9BACI|nr:MMPL family transporter [Bacillus canaveralius]PLR81405.1 hypothetical protein CU635_15085 [Bacillus canaveralius]PLR90056.1 hypothetical protein CVD25_20440 [Bacillus canaveralius]